MRILKNCFGALVVVLVCACAATPKSAGDGLFFTVTHSEAVPAAEDSENMLELEFSLLDSTESRLGKFVRGLLYDGQSAEEYAAKVTDDLKTAYRLTLEENGEWGFDQSWSFSEEQEVSVTGQFALITRHSFVYEGGAHPNYGTLHYVFDLKAPKALGFEDVIAEEGLSGLYTLVDRELRLYADELTGQPLSPNAPLSAGIYFEDSVAPADFYPAADGLHFSWNPYEIAAYTYGEIEITLDWDDLLLSSDGAKLAAAYRADKR
jgi:hypothetical protein